MKFSDVLASVAPNGKEWTALVPAEWAQGRTVFGGLQAALMARAMRGVLADASSLPLRSVQLTFIAPVAAGTKLRLRPELLRSGKSATHARCDLYSGNDLACCAVAIFGAARRSRITLDIPRLAFSRDPETLSDMPHVPGITRRLPSTFNYAGHSAPCLTPGTTRPDRPFSRACAIRNAMPRTP